MASIAMMIGAAVPNAAAFTGGNYLAKYLLGDGKAALEEKTQHDKALKVVRRLWRNAFATAPFFLIGSKPTGKSWNKRNRTSKMLITLSNSISRRTQTSK